MAERIKFLGFEDWILYLFDHVVSEPKWYFETEAPVWVGPPELNVEYITRLFENPVSVLSDYSDAQLNQGFWFLVSNGASDCMFALMEESIPIERRLRCIQSFVSVFVKIFAARCSPHLSHLDEPGASPLNLACYMWWDIIPLGGPPNSSSGKLLNAAALGVMAETLNTESIACQESALHGLGHWHSAYPAEVESIIDRFLASHYRLRPETVNYAKSARCGCVQ